MKNFNKMIGIFLLLVSYSMISTSCGSTSNLSNIPFNASTTPTGDYDDGASGGGDSPNIANPDQTDLVGDGLGDECNGDIDDDDNCLVAEDVDQTDEEIADDGYLIYEAEEDEIEDGNLVAEQISPEDSNDDESPTESGGEPEGLQAYNIDAEAALQNISKGISQIIMSTQLKNFKSTTVQFANINGKDKNIVFGKCSNKLWPETRTQFGAPLKDEAWCWDFDKTTGYIPEDIPGIGSNFKFALCWITGGDCGYFTFLGWYFDFIFPTPKFSISNSGVTVNIDSSAQQIAVDFNINNLFIEAPESLLRWKHWYVSDYGKQQGWDNLGPPDYPNAWMHCCQSVIWDNGEEWNPFYHSLSLKNIGATLLLSYDLDISSGNLNIYLNQFLLKKLTSSGFSYALDNVWPAGSIGDKYVEPAIQKGLERILFSKINEYIDHFNKHYGSLSSPIPLKSASSSTPLNTKSKILDVDFGPHLQKMGQLLEQDADLQTSLIGIIDKDQDGLSDWDEFNIYYTDPLDPDTDGDGLTDGDEVNMYGTNPKNKDTDGDNVDDKKEIDMGTNPLQKDNPAVIMTIINLILEEE